MDNYVVSARKYRPKGFEEVVGQSHITTTLTNAIQNKQLAQAMLFCGPRGIGKTTCARIVARMINEFDETENNTLNIFELDAASNNSVDDIRSLIDQVRYPPQQGNYKVYIIDEVHMLSTAAFNAFLKTLEEPPSYAIFILATTEKHKVIPTILSRCQIFDFNRIQIADISSHLAHIAQEEGIEAEPEALHLIAQKADGALRDALSIFDLMVTFSSDRKISYQNTIDNLHILDYDYYFRITEEFLSGVSSTPILTFDEILQKGFDGHHFVVGLNEHFRNLLLSKFPETVNLMEAPDSVKARFLQQCANLEESWLLSAMNITNQCDLNYKTSKNQRLLVELTLLKLTHLNDVLNLSPSNGAELKKKTSVAPTVPKPSDLPKAAEAPKTAEVAPPVAKEKLTEEEITEPLVDSPGSVGQTATNTASQAVNEVHNAEAIISLHKKVKIRSSSSLPKREDVLREIKEVTTKKEEVVVEEIKGEREINLEELKEKWEEFQKNRKLTNGRESESMVLKKDWVYDNHVITLQLSNTVEQDILQSLHVDLVQFLRHSLNNRYLEVKSAVAETEREDMIYTNKDKFNYLLKINPKLKELSDRLGLDPDF